MNLRLPWRQVLGTTLVFAAIGPLAGALPWAAMMMYETIGRGHGALEVDSVIESFLGLAFFAYLFGLIPAALAGVVAGLARRRWSGRRWILVSALMGFGVGTLYGLVVFGERGGGALGMQVLQTVFIFGVPGLLGGAVASAVLARGKAAQPASS